MGVVIAALCWASAAAAVPRGAVAVVNGSVITLAAFRAERVQTPDRGEALETLITRELLVQQAAREQISVSDREVEEGEREVRARLGPKLDELLERRGEDAAAFRRGLRASVLARKVIDADVKARLIPPGERAVKDYFDRITAYLAMKSTAAAGLDADAAAALRADAARVKALSTERVRVRRIVFKFPPRPTSDQRLETFDRALAAKTRLDQGADFAALARELSEDAKSAARGGDVGYVLRTAKPTIGAKAAFALEVGQTSGPVGLADGYELIHAVEKVAGGPARLEDCAEGLAESLSTLAFDRAYAAYVKGLSDAAAIERRPLSEL